MAFIRTKRVKGTLYRYRVESKRIGGKVQQHVLEYLGRVSAKPPKSTQKPKAKRVAKAARKTAKRATGRAKPKARKAGRSKKKRK